MAAPLFSIITVTYNAEPTLPPTLRSIEAQTLTDFELLVIDGASTDGTLRLLADSPIKTLKVVSEPDSGIYDAMNKGMAMATGDYLIFMNAGDAFPEADTLTRYAEAIRSRGVRPGIVYGQTRIVDAGRHPVGMRHLTAPEDLTARSFAYGMLVCHQAMAVDRSIAGPYNTAYRFSADYDWVIRCLHASPRNVYTGAVTAEYLEEGMTSANRRQSLIERFRIMSGYYGCIPTIIRHFWFATRALGRKIRKLT